MSAVLLLSRVEGRHYIASRGFALSAGIRDGVDGGPAEADCECDGHTSTCVLHIPREMLRVGENTMTLTQDPSGGSLVVVANDLAILIGERIREYRGY